MKHHSIFSLAAATSLLACSGGGPVNIGENHPARTGESLTDYAATWDGYVEAYQFASGSDRVRLVLDASGQGYLQLGDAALLPAPTDPNVGWGNAGADGARDTDARMHEGFRYGTLQAAVAEGRIQFGLDDNEFFKAWCELQTPVAWLDPNSGAPYTYSCIPYSSESRGCTLVLPSGDVSYDCGKLALCSYPGDPCSCDAAGCSVTPPPSAVPVSEYATNFDAALEDDGDELVGTLVLDHERVTVRLKRQ